MTVVEFMDAHATGVFITIVFVSSSICGAIASFGRRGGKDE